MGALPMPEETWARCPCYERKKMPSKKRVIVGGGGLAGLACTIKLAEDGVDVDLFSMVPVKRSHSVCAQGGINACNDIARQQGYSEWEHFDETIYGGDYLAAQDHRPARPSGRPLQPHARGPAGAAPLRRVAVQAHVFRRRHDGSAT